MTVYRGCLAKPGGVTLQPSGSNVALTPSSPPLRWSLRRGCTSVLVFFAFCTHLPFFSPSPRRLKHSAHAAQHLVLRWKHVEGCCCSQGVIATWGCMVHHLGTSPCPIPRRRRHLASPPESRVGPSAPPWTTNWNARSTRTKPPLHARVHSDLPSRRAALRL
jgi:hypothetical protein